MAWFNSGLQRSTWRKGLPPDTSKVKSWPSVNRNRQAPCSGRRSRIPVGQNERRNLMAHPRLYADFQNLDDENRLRLTSAGTRRDLERQALGLREGMLLTLCTDDAMDDGQS